MVKPVSEDGQGTFFIYNNRELRDELKEGVDSFIERVESVVNKALKTGISCGLPMAAEAVFPGTATIVTAAMSLPNKDGEKSCDPCIHTCTRKTACIATNFWDTNLAYSSVILH